MVEITAVLDSCILYPFYVRDLLLYCAHDGLYQPFWTEKILQDATKHLIEDGRMTAEQAKSLEERIRNVFPEAMLEVPETLVAVMTNEPEDHHVLAAAVFAPADYVVTTNLKDFREKDLLPWGKTAVSPDEFLSDLLELSPDRMRAVLEMQAGAKRKPPMDVEGLLEILEKQLPNFVQAIRSLDPEPPTS